DNAGNGLLNSVRLSGMYSYKMKVNKKYYVLAGADLAFNYKSLDKDLLVFGDQIDPNNGQIFLSSSAEVDNIESSKGFLDLSFGAVGYSEKFYLGFAAHHLNKPDDSFFISNTTNGQIIDPQSELPMKFTAHAGANFSISGNAKKGIIADGPFMTAGLIFQNQGAADQLNLGLSITDKSLSGGVWYRRNSENSDAIILVAGYTINNTTLGFSYDITVSDLSGETGGAFELSARFQLPCRQPKKRIEPMTCPKF
ncbi:MAG: PorP/SprF family type IX secretion system membrane protein, partial [Flavobacteriales bacterium]